MVLYTFDAMYFSRSLALEALLHLTLIEPDHPVIYFSEAHDDLLYFLFFYVHGVSSEPLVY
ncbi:hypothetical protein D3C86_1881610 [compost metagenome]